MFTHVIEKPILPELHSITTDKGRIYVTPEGNRYPSVTTVLGASKKKSLEEWKKKVGEEEANKIGTRATFRGTQVHTLAENYLNNVEKWNEGIQPANVFTFSTIRDILDKSVNNIWYQEAPLYSDRLRTAGRLDLLAEYDGVLSIIDFKTSLRPKKKEWIDSYELQVSFYAAAFYERTGVKVKDYAIIIAVDDNEPQVFTGKTFDRLNDFITLRNSFMENNID